MIGLSGESVYSIHLDFFEIFQRQEECKYCANGCGEVYSLPMPHKLSQWYSWWSSDKNGFGAFLTLKYCL